MPQNKHLRLSKQNGSGQSVKRKGRFLSALKALSGFTLVETSFSLGVAGFCLITIFGLLPVGLTSNQTAIQQAAARNISSAIVSDLRMTQPLGLNASPRYGFTIPGAGAGMVYHTVYVSTSGSATVMDTPPVTNGASSSVYRATVFFYPPAANSQNLGQRSATEVRVLVSWPALADSVPSKTPSNYTGSFDAQTALDCN